MSRLEAYKAIHSRSRLSSVYDSIEATSDKVKPFDGRQIERALRNHLRLQYRELQTRWPLLHKHISKVPERELAWHFQTALP